MDSLNEKLNQYKIPFALSLVGLVLIIGGIFSSGLVNHPSKKLESNSFPKESLVKKTQIKVDISGAVLKPGVYGLAIDSRVEDAIKVAGGFDASASAEFISKRLNLSQKLSDGQKVYIPFEGEKYAGSVAGVAVEFQKIGINSATQAQLEDLPGIGPVAASKIISQRPYSDLNELLAKKAVTRSVFEKIKDLIDLN